MDFEPMSEDRAALHAASRSPRIQFMIQIVIQFMIQLQRHTPRVLGALIALILLTGCSITIHSSRRYEPRMRPAVSVRYAPPALPYNDEIIDRRLRAAISRRQELWAASVRQQTLVTNGAASFEDLVRALDAAYRAGTSGDALLRAKHPDGNILTFDDPRITELARIDARYKTFGRGGSLALKVTRRTGVHGSLAIAFPPGSLARPYIAPVNDARFSSWPEPLPGNAAGTPTEQDLALLVPRIAWLDPGANEIELRFPIACGRFDRGTPADGARFFLLRFDALDPMDSLLNEIAIQMAIWMLRDNLSWEDFVASRMQRGPLITFETGRNILERDAFGAVEVLLESGIDPRRMRYFRH
jgi:hypothetical protein